MEYMWLLKDHKRMGSRGRDLSTVGVVLTSKTCLTITCPNLSVFFINGLSVGWVRKEVATSGKLRDKGSFIKAQCDVYGVVKMTFQKATCTSDIANKLFTTQAIP